MVAGLFFSGVFLGAVGLLWSTSLLLAFFGTSAIEFERELSLLLVPGVGYVAAVLAVLGGVFARRDTGRGAWFLLSAGALGTLGQTVVGLMRFGTVATVEELLLITLLSGWWAIGPALVGVAVLLRGVPPPAPPSKGRSSNRGSGGARSDR